MTGPMVTPDRETLAKAVRDAVIKWNTFGTGKTSSDVSTHVADALIASGAVTTAADAVRAWAEDEALVEAIVADQREAAESWGEPLPGAELKMRARTGLRALAAALGGES